MFRLCCGFVLLQILVFLLVLANGLQLFLLAFFACSWFLQLHGNCTSCYCPLSTPSYHMKNGDKSNLTKLPYAFKL